MFVCFWFRDVGKVEDAAGMQHRFSQRLLLLIIHAIEVDGHQESTGLVIGNLSGGDAVDEVRDLFTRQDLAVSLFPDYVLRSQPMFLSYSPLAPRPGL